MNPPNNPNQQEPDLEADPDKPEDLSNPADVKKRKNLAKVHEKLIALGIAETMATRQGRALFNDLFGFCGVFRSSFTGDAQTFFNEGKRNVALRYLAMITKDHPKEYIELLKENIQ
jgi:hypothetical protein